MKTKVCEEARNSMSEEVMKIEANLDKRIAGLATKADLEIAVTRTQTDISVLKSDISNLATKMDAGMVKMAADISNLATKMDAGMVKMEAGFQVATSELKFELLASNDTQFRWLVGSQIAIVITFVGSMVGLMVGLDVFSK